MRDIDLAFRAGKPQREPFLRLAAVFAAPGVAGDLRRNVVVEPFGDFAETFNGTDVGFLAQLAQRRRPRILARIDAALRQLPHMRSVNVLGAADAAANKGEPGAIEHHQAGTRPIGKVFERSHE